jgi:uncharacterized protein (TIGR00255 family)
MKSMTGFGRAARGIGELQVAVEARSVNHKGLDVKIKLPRPHGALEEAIGKRARARLERGRVDVSVEVTRAHASRTDEAALLAAAREAMAWADALGGSRALTAGDLLRAAQVGPRADGDPLRDPAVEQGVLTLVEEALEELARSRTHEGAGLAATLEAHATRIDALRAALVERTRLAPDKLRERTQARIATLGVALDPARLAQEVALIVDRVDVSEELARLGMHVTKMRALLLEARSGRALDFLCQELLREANTTGSKSQDAEVAHLVVELKTEIERAREQAQNVE